MRCTRHLIIAFQYIFSGELHRKDNNEMYIVTVRYFLVPEILIWEDRKSNFNVLHSKYESFIYAVLSQYEETLLLMSNPQKMDFTNDSILGDLSLSTGWLFRISE
jgi:hypothetical protein